MDVDRNGLKVLDRDECLRLLDSATLGRVAVTSAAVPTVLPVNFRLAGDRIVFRTGKGTKLAAATRNAVVAFEVDDIDPVQHTEWSVVVTGVACPIVDPSERRPGWSGDRALGGGRGRPHGRGVARARLGTAHTAGPAPGLTRRSPGGHGRSGASGALRPRARPGAVPPASAS